MAVTETLALRATIVGNPIPSYTSYTEDGRFGTSPSGRRRAPSSAPWSGSFKSGTREDATDGRSPRIGVRASRPRSSAGVCWRR